MNQQRSRSLQGREQTEPERERVCDQAKGCSRASLPAGGLWPESLLEAGARVTDLKKKNGFRLHSPPLSAKKSSFFSTLISHGKSQQKKKKKVSSGQLLPSFVGRFPAADAVGSLCSAFFLSNGQFLVHNQTENSLAGSRPGLQKLLRAEGASTFLNPLVSHRSNPRHWVCTELDNETWGGGGWQPSKA